MRCTWPVDRKCLPVAEGEAETVAQQAAEDLAVSVLWALTGRQFGECPVIARPCPEPCTTSGGLAAGPGWFPVWAGDLWRNVRCGCGSGRCEISGPSVVHLGSTTALPVIDVVEVRVAGEIMDPSEYVLEGDILYRRGGVEWPDQDLTRPLGEPGTWSVEYTQGNRVPAGAGVLVATLAKEFMAACGSGGKCRLPRNVQSVSRQGVTYQMYDASGIYRDGLTGLSEIDMWITSVNPHRLQAPPRVR